MGQTVDAAFRRGVGALAIGTVGGGEQAYLLELARASQRRGVRSARREHLVEHRLCRDELPRRGLDQPRSHAIPRGQEPVLGENLRARSGLWRTLQLQTRQRLDQRDEWGHVRERRLGVHRPDLDGSEIGLRSHVPPEEARIGYGSGTDHGFEGVHVVGVAGEGPR